MIVQLMSINLKPLLIFSAVAFFVTVLLPTSSVAQGFSGTSASSYSCVGVSPAATPDTVCPTGDKPPCGTRSASDRACPCFDTTTNKFICGWKCVGSGCTVLTTRDALPKPPQLRQLEVWFVQIVYALWGFAGVTFTLTLMGLGLMYMTSQGNPEKIAQVRNSIGKWAIGFALVFLAYPILNTVFSVIGLNPCLTEEIQLPGFQFFFETAVDPTGAGCTP